MDDTRTQTRKRAERRGRLSESVAAWMLMAKGYRILGRRVRNHAGELDLIARTPSGIVCFVEVKARKEREAAAYALGPKQQGRIARAAALYMAQRPKLGAARMRFDVITVTPLRLPRHVRDAWRPSAP